LSPQEREEKQGMCTVSLSCFTGIRANHSQVLVRSDPVERLEAFERLLDGLRAFVEQGLANKIRNRTIDASPENEANSQQITGSFWGGGPSLGLVDCVLLPYAYRLYVLEHYRGAAFAVPKPSKKSESPLTRAGICVDNMEATEKENALWAWYHKWLAECLALPNVQRTLPDKARYLEHVKKYAEGKARSKVGNAVRRGADAHAYDDKLDGGAQK